MSEFEIVNLAGLSMLETVRKHIVEENLKTQGEIFSYLDNFIAVLRDVVENGNPKGEMLYNLLSL